MKFKEAYTYTTIPPSPSKKSLEICTEGANAQVESPSLSELFIVPLQQHPSFGLSHVLLPLTEQVESPQKLLKANRFS